MTETIRDVSGYEWKAGCLPRTTKVGEINPKTEEPFFRIFKPEDTPRAPGTSGSAIDPDLVWHIIDQARQSSCCGCMGVQLLMVVRAIMGLDRVILSQAVPYSLGNGGRDAGMAIDTCLKHLLETGTCPIDVIDQYDWDGRNRGTWPTDWREVAASYRALEAEDCISVDDMDAANELGYPVGYGAKRHAVIHIGPGLDINSYNRSWGNNGIGRWTTRRERADGIRQYGAWVLRVATDPDNDGDLPQPKE